MAAARHNPTRRALLGAVFVAPVVLGGAAVAAPGRRDGRAKWDRALAAYRRAEAAQDAFRIDHAEPASRAYDAVRDRWPVAFDFDSDPGARAIVKAALAEHEPYEDRFDDLDCARLAALKRLLRIPAPDLPALALKIELSVDEEVGTLEGGERCLAVLKADGWRLAGSD